MTIYEKHILWAIYQHYLFYIGQRQILHLLHAFWHKILLYHIFKLSSLFIFPFICSAESSTLYLKLSWRQPAFPPLIFFLFWTSFRKYFSYIQLKELVSVLWYPLQLECFFDRLVSAHFVKYLQNLKKKPQVLNPINENRVFFKKSL